MSGVLVGGLSKPSDVAAPVREAGGDNEVPRDSRGRPRIRVTCICEDSTLESFCDVTGKVKSPKTGKPIKCQKCKGEGFVLRAFTRTTTYIDVIEDKSNLEAWQMRMVLVGAALDQGLLSGVEDLHLAQAQAEADLRMLGPDGDPDDRESLSAAAKEAKDELNRRAQVAKIGAGAEAKADKGTALHGLSELRDQGLDLPKGISFEDVLDLHAYSGIAEGFSIVHMEKLVVQDDIGVAGTPDRVSEWAGDAPLVAPDGTEFVAGDGHCLITDLKTGTVEFGGLKMAMQLAIYSRSKLYDHKTGARTPMPGVNQKWGVIMNVPAGTGQATLHWADLEMGWRAVQVAGEVRALRSLGRKALTRFEPASGSVVPVATLGK